MVLALTLVGVVVDEGIVGLHVVGLDVDVVGGGVADDDGLWRLAEAEGEAGLVAKGSDVADAEGPLADGLRDGAGDLGLTVRVDEVEELLVLVIEADASAGDLLDVKTGLGAEIEEAVAPIGTARRLTPVDEILHVGVVLDVAAPVPTAGVSRELDAVAHDADAMVVGAHVDGLADEVGRDRVGIGVEADAGFFGHDHRDDDVCVEGVWWQRAQAWALDQ
ncbi:MAG TPA: hypothetical protein VFG23_26475 [Polyangia bacterium]|nr:hypothetical protein [Polyangia bacterium]